MPIFVHDDGRVLGPTARYLWDRFLETDADVVDYVQDDLAESCFARSREAAERQGETVFEQLVQEHQRNLAREREKGVYAFAARRRAIERIGLPEVRDYRIARLEEEERQWREELEQKADFQPGLVPLILVKLRAYEEET